MTADRGSYVADAQRSWCLRCRDYVGHLCISEHPGQTVCAPDGGWGSCSCWHCGRQREQADEKDRSEVER